MYQLHQSQLQLQQVGTGLSGALLAMFASIVLVSRLQGKCDSSDCVAAAMTALGAKDLSHHDAAFPAIPADHSAPEAVLHSSVM